MNLPTPARWAFERVEQCRAAALGVVPNPANIDVWISNQQGWRIYHIFAAFIEDSEGETAESLRAERDEADRRAGAAERRIADLQDSASKRAAWLAKAKQDAGYSHLTSFDRVWADALPLLVDARNNKQPPAMDGMPVLDNGLNTLIGGDCGVLDLVRKHEGSRHGLIMNLVRLQEWLDLYVARAKTPADPREVWDWLTSQTALELQYHRPIYADDDDLSEEWRVYRWNGPINDRERETVGAGLSPLLAIEDARAKLDTVK